MLTRTNTVGADYALYEANPDRVDGRVWTATFPNGQTGEHGAERIDTRHTHMLALADEFGLELDDHIGQTESEAPTIVRYQGENRDEGSAVADRTMIAGILRSQTSAAGIVYEQGRMAGSSDPAVRAFDALSVRDRVRANVFGGAVGAAGPRCSETSPS
ncbi:FAD-dependent oxidoreductase [Herbiconiux sp. P16]|uniref:FAD-dependent oxidoreductase n=1 Tax=Herbiconiux wuyangfengii TaxID=3342794 RepID=UPI0035BB6A2D